MASGFLKLRCIKCKNEQMVFGKPSSQVKCVVCDDVLMRSTGGKGSVEAQKAQVLEILE